MIIQGQIFFSLDLFVKTDYILVNKTRYGILKSTAPERVVLFSTRLRLW